MIISLFGDRTVKVTDGQAKHIDQLMDQKPKPEFIKLDGNRIKTSEITGIWSDGQWDRMKHEKMGEWQCADGHWHAQKEKWCMIDRPQPKPDFRELRAEPTAESRTFRQKWLRIIQLNSKLARESGKYGTLRSLEELESFESSGQWPVAGGVV